MAVDEAVYKAIVSLHGNADFVRVVDWIVSEREAAKESMTSRPLSDLPVLQGEARALGRLLAAIKEAPDVVRQLNSP